MATIVLVYTGVSIVRSSHQFGISWQTNARTRRQDQELLRFVCYFQYTFLLKKIAMNDFVMTAKTIVQIKVISPEQLEQMLKACWTNQNLKQNKQPIVVAARTNRGWPGMPVSLRGVNQRFRSHLRCLGGNDTVFSCQSRTDNNKSLLFTFLGSISAALLTLLASATFLNSGWQSRLFRFMRYFSGVKCSSTLA